MISLAIYWLLVKLGGTSRRMWWNIKTASRCLRGKHYWCCDDEGRQCLFCKKTEGKFTACWKDCCPTVRVEEECGLCGAFPAVEPCSTCPLGGRTL